MTQNKCSANCACQAAVERAEVDPIETLRTVAAGGVCGSECAPSESYDSDTVYAAIQFPIQTYRTGFCPCEALCMGTLFPELVSPFTPRGCWS